MSKFLEKDTQKNEQAWNNRENLKKEKEQKPVTKI